MGVLVTKRKTILTMPISPPTTAIWVSGSSPRSMPNAPNPAATTAMKLSQSVLDAQKGFPFSMFVSLKDKRA